MAVYELIPRLMPKRTWGDFPVFTERQVRETVRTPLDRIRVMHNDAAMPAGKQTKRKQSQSAEKGSHTVRITVSFPGRDHEMLCALAQKLDVSTSWVVRKAVERLLAEREPLFRPEQPFG
jgi:hypothetical protein